MAAASSADWSRVDGVLRDTALKLERGSPALRATGLDIRNPEGAPVIQAPHAIVSVGGLSLLTGNLSHAPSSFRTCRCVPC